MWTVIGQKPRRKILRGGQLFGFELEGGFMRAGEDRRDPRDCRDLEDGRPVDVITLDPIQDRDLVSVRSGRVLFCYDREMLLVSLKQTLRNPSTRAEFTRNELMDILSQVHVDIRDYPLVEAALGPLDERDREFLNDVANGRARYMPRQGGGAAAPAPKPFLTRSGPYLFKFLYLPELSDAQKAEFSEILILRRIENIVFKQLIVEVTVEEDERAQKLYGQFTDEYLSKGNLSGLQRMEVHDTVRGRFRDDEIASKNFLRGNFKREVRNNFA